MSRRDANCSFCRKNYRDVGPLVEGPDEVYICGECVELCESIIDQERRRRGQPSAPAPFTSVRPEEPGDQDAIRAVHQAAFPTPAEARLVDALRAAGKLSISLVAERYGVVVGHIAFSPVEVNGAAGGLGLAPVAVLPVCQRKGVGQQLILAGLGYCKGEGAPFVVVLGHPTYYPRFGFAPAAPLGLSNEYGATDAFMAIELRPGGIPAGGGLVRYGPEFAAFA
jgi:putative acetyltransferase